MSLSDIESKLRKITSGANVHEINNIVQLLRVKIHDFREEIKNKSRREDLICRAMERFNSLIQEFHDALCACSDLGEEVSKKEYRMLLKRYRELIVSSTILISFAYINLGCDKKCLPCENKELCDNLRSILE